MSFTVLSDTDFNKISGTFFQGSIDIPYLNLENLFGTPIEGYEKTDAEWWIEFADGEVCTIYNWKNGQNYCGDSGIPTEAICHWNIGGYNQSVCEKLMNLILSETQRINQRLIESI